MEMWLFEKLETKHSTTKKPRQKKNKKILLKTTRINIKILLFPNSQTTIPYFYQKRLH